MQQPPSQPSIDSHRTSAARREGVAGGLVDHFDRALRQLSPADQTEVLDALAQRIETRLSGSGAAAARSRRCYRKRRHATLEEAGTHRRKLGLLKLEAYRCDVCGGAHLGHRRQDRA